MQDAYARMSFLAWASHLDFICCGIKALQAIVRPSLSANDDSFNTAA